MKFSRNAGDGRDSIAPQFGQAVGRSWSVSTTVGVSTGSVSGRWSLLTGWLTADDDRNVENFNAETKAPEMTERRRNCNGIEDVVTFAAPLVRAELQELIRQFLATDDGLVRCVDWEGAALEVLEDGVFTTARRRVAGSWATVQQSLRRLKQVNEMTMIMPEMTREESGSVWVSRVATSMARDGVVGS